MAMTEAEQRMSAEGTRNISKSELKEARDMGEISQEEYDDKMLFIQKMEEQAKKQNSRRRRLLPKPKPKPKMMGGGMAGKKPRMGHMDYRKGGMMYKTTKG